MEKDKSPFTKQWILDTGIPIVASYGGNLTLRALHYRLVAAGMTNDIAHYKKVVNTMIEARWKHLVRFSAFMDHERETLGFTDYRESNVEDAVTFAKQQIKAWASSYKKNMWENQPYYPEVFIEKKALQGGGIRIPVQRVGRRPQSLQGLSIFNVPVQCQRTI